MHYPLVAEIFVKAGGEICRDIYVRKDLIEEKGEDVFDQEARRLIEFERKMLAIRNM